MLIETLPNAVLDAVVKCAGFDQGWRLEVVCASLRASSMECAASRLGKCRWIGESPRAGTEFKPCWRHVAVAMRSGQYVLSFAGGVIHPLFEFKSPIEIGSGYMTFKGGRERGEYGPGSRTTTSRRQAMKFVVEPAPCLPAFTAGGPQNKVGPEGTGGYIQEVGSTRPQGNVGLVILGPNNRSARASLDTVIEPHLEMMKTWWLLHLESHVSHLPVCWGMRRNSEGQGPGRGPDTALRTSVCLTSHTTDSLKVESWELAPTALAPDERFEFQRNPVSRGK